MRCLQSWLRLSTRQTLAPAGHHGARHDDGHKTRSEQITTTTPQLGKESLDKTSLMCISQDIRDLARRRPALGWPEETTRPWPRPHVERTKGKIRLLVHPSSFGEMAPSNLHGYPRALSDNYKPNTRHRLPWHWTRQAGILVKHTVMAGRYLHELDPSLFRKSDSSKPLSLARSHSGYLITRHLGIAAIVSSGPWHGQHGHDPLAGLIVIG